MNGSPQVSDSLSPPRAPILGAERPARPWRLQVVREMLATLETQTTAGQQHLMSKIVLACRDQIRLDTPALGRHDHERLVRSLQELERESDRFMPDQAAFVRRAEKLIDLLATFS